MHHSMETDHTHYLTVFKLFSARLYDFDSVIVLGNAFAQIIEALIDDGMSAAFQGSISAS